MSKELDLVPGSRIVPHQRHKRRRRIGQVPDPGNFHEARRFEAHRCDYINPSVEVGHSYARGAEGEHEGHKYGNPEFTLIWVDALGGQGSSVWFKCSLCLQIRDA